MSEQSLEVQINDRMKEAMRGKDRKTSMLMRMIKSQVTEKVTSKNYKGEEGDELWFSVIESYVKSSKKNLKEYLDLGSAGAEHAEQVQWEIEALSCYLPQLADVAQTTIWVEEAIAELGGAEQANIGRVMGGVIKAHKGEVDPALVKSLAQSILS